MKASRSKDPLTAATKSILLPSLAQESFRLKTNRVIARVSSDVLQFLYLQLSGYGDKDFCVNFGSITLFCPRDFLTLSPGDRLRRTKRAETWFPALAHETADASMHEVVSLIRAQAMPFFRSTDTPKAMLKRLKAEHWGSIHHLEFEIACCLAKLGRIKESERHALHALDLYRKDGRPWAEEGIILAERLLASLRAGSVATLLDQWTEHTIARLRLQKFMIAQHKTA